METAGSSETSYPSFRTLQSPGTEDLQNTFNDHLIFLNKEPPLIPNLAPYLSYLQPLLCPFLVNNCNAFTCLSACPASCKIHVEIHSATCADGLSLSARLIRFPTLCAALTSLLDESGKFCGAAGSCVARLVKPLTSDQNITCL